jgi:tRNA A-37 threonylcarbamoyl transferase component Bud32
VSDEIRWRAGARKLRSALGPALLDPDAAGAERTVLRDRPRRRRLERLRLATGETLFLKHFYAGAGRHRLRDQLKRRLALGTARREWRALSQLQRAGVAVPEPRALLELPGGDEVIAMGFLEGQALPEALGPGGAQRRALLDAVGALVARLHAAGFAHRDLHGGNILVADGVPLLIDFQAAWPTRSRLARLRDLGELDNSLAGALSTADRVRLRAAVLGIHRPFGPTARRQLRAVGRASRARERAHAVSRTRRSLIPGRLATPLRFRDYRGLRLRSVPERVVVAALDAHLGAGGAPNTAPLARDARSRITAVEAGGQRLVVKEVRAGGALRRAADLLRGSPARRAWRGGHGLRARRIGAATPFAFVERRRLGVTTASAVVLEDLRPLPAADRCGGDFATPEQLVSALADLAIALHRRGVIHGDLKASHVRLAKTGGGLEARLLDLEGVRFPRRLGDGQRIRALAELNASLADGLPDALRCRAFLRYAAALPFRRGRDAALRRVVAVSLARAHRWSGADCSVAQRFRS